MNGYVLVFPGQGSQRLGMGVSFAHGWSVAAKLYEDASRILGYDLIDLCSAGPIERLSDTGFTQPALYVTSCAGLEALRTVCGVLEPEAVAGHSVGEYAALYAAGAVTFETGLRLVQRRAELMREAAKRRPGAMAAVLGLTVDVVEECCARARRFGVVVVANDNCPGQVVISGEVAAVDQAGELARQSGARRIVKLPVSGGFHSPLMDDAAAGLRNELARVEIRDPRLPVISNVAAGYAATAEAIREKLAEQVAGRVRWRESMELVRPRIEHLFEIGTGDVLCGLMRRIAPEVGTLAVQDMESVTEACRRLGSSCERGGDCET